MGTCGSIDSPNESRDPRESGEPFGGSENGMLVRFRVRLQHGVVHRFILRRPVSPVPGGALEWLARRMRIRIPAHSFRAAGATVVAAVIVGPITLTLVAAHKAGLGLPLAAIERFASPDGQAPASDQAALQGSPPAIQPQPERAGKLTAGNIPPQKSDGFVESLSDTITDEFAKQVAALPVASKPPSSQAGSSAASSGWPLRPAQQRLGQKLQDGYLWRAWMEKAAEFHGKRTHGKSLLIYHPGEGYAVLSAAYRPMIQPVKPRGGESEPQDRSIYQNRREPRMAPGELSPEPEPNARPADGRSQRGSSAPLGNVGNSFQPWDSQIMTDPFGPANALASRVPGLRIERVVLFQGFSTNGYPVESGRIPFFNSNLGYDIDVGAMATISWTRARPTSSLFMVYTPSHFQRMRYSEWNSTDHQLGFGANKSFRRWAVSVNSNNGVRGLPEVLFTPAVTRTVADAPGNFDELLQAAEGGQLSSDEIASVLTGAPVIEEQPKTRFDRGRVLSASLDTSATYQASPRLSATFGVGANHYRALSTPEVEENVVGLRSVDNATSVGANGSMNYRLSPELSVGVNSGVRRSFSTFGEASSVNTTGTVTRRLGRRWSLNGGVGIGTVTGSRVGLEHLARTHSSWIVNGGLQYAGREHRVNFSGSRMLGDSVGIGAQVSHNVGADWQWSRTGTPWGLYGRGNWYQMSLDDFHNTQGTFFGGGLIRQLSRETSFQAEYSYQTFNSPFRGVVSNLSGHRLQMSWMWRPAGAPR